MSLNRSASFFSLSPVIDRRRFLRFVRAGAAGGLLGPRAVFADPADAGATAAFGNQIVDTDRPPNVEMPLYRFADDITPAGKIEKHRSCHGASLTDDQAGRLEPYAFRLRGKPE